MALSKIDSEIEQVDQEKYLRQATSYYQALEKPLKYGPAVDSLPDLIAALHREFESNYVNIEMVNHLLLSYKSNPREWRKYAKFDRYSYTRNLVDAGNGKFNLLILCWGEGHGSSVHDHADSHCFMKMLKGDLREKRYAYPNRSGRDTGRGHHPDGEIDSRELVEIGETPIAVNDVALGFSFPQTTWVCIAWRIPATRTPPSRCISTVRPLTSARCSRTARKKPLPR